MCDEDQTLEKETFAKLMKINPAEADIVLFINDPFLTFPSSSISLIWIKVAKSTLMNLSVDSHY
jgi:hypothetical protein